MAVAISRKHFPPHHGSTITSTNTRSPPRAARSPSLRRGRRHACFPPRAIAMPRSSGGSARWTARAPMPRRSRSTAWSRRPAMPRAPRITPRRCACCARRSRRASRTTPEKLTRGQYLFEHVSLCVDCHSTCDWMEYAARSSQSCCTRATAGWPWTTWRRPWHTCDSAGPAPAREARRRAAAEVAPRVRPAAASCRRVPPCALLRPGTRSPCPNASR